MIAFFASLAGVAEAGVVRVATGPVVADGTTAAEVRLWTDTPAEKLKIVPLSGQLGQVSVSPDGVILVRWTPAAVAQPGEVPWTVTLGKENVTLGIPVTPAITAKMAVAVDPPVVKPGAVASLKITGAPGELPVLVRASTGTLGAPVRETDGWRVSWTAPKATAPLVGVFTVADARYPDLAWATGVARVPAHQTVKVDVPSGSKSVLVVGADKLSPKSSTATTASFDVEVDPSARTGTLEVTKADGTVESRGVILASGAAALEWIPGPTSYAGQAVAVLRLAAVGADGGMLVATAPRVTATAGTVRDLRVDGQLWRVELALPPTTGPLTVTAEFAGVKSDVKLDSAALAPLKLTTGALPAEGGDVEVKAPVAASLEIREGKGTPKAVGGETVVRLTPAPDAARVVAVGHPVVAPSSLSPRRLALWADTPVLLADGAATSGVTVLVLDAAGAPVREAIVAVRMVGGDGAIPSEAHTDLHGIAHLTYTAGKTPGPVGLRFDVGSLWSELPLFQAAAGSPGPALAGALEPVAATWRDAIAWSTIWREGKAPPAPPLVGAPFVAAPPSASVAPVASAGGKAPRQPGPVSAGSDRDGPWLAVGLTDSHGEYWFAGVGAGLVAVASAKSPPIGFLGIEGQLDWALAEGPAGAFGPVARVHLRAEPVASVDGKAMTLQHDVLAGGRWRPVVPGTIAPDLVVAVRSITAVGFEDEGGTTGVFTAGAFGICPGIGARMPAGTVELEAGASMTFAPGLVGEFIELAGEVGTNAMRPRISLAYDHRSFEVDSAVVAQRRVVVGGGVSFQ